MWLAVPAHREMGGIFGTYPWKRPIFSELYSGISFAA